MENHMDVNDIYLYLKFKIVKAIETDIEAADKLGFTNLPISSLCQDNTLDVGETQIGGGQQNLFLCGLYQ